MDGFRVMPILDAAAIGDIFVTVTGDINVIDTPSFDRMRSGVVLANSGHFDAEINLVALRGMTEGQRTLRDNVEEYTLRDGRKIVVITKDDGGKPGDALTAANELVSRDGVVMIDAPQRALDAVRWRERLLEHGPIRYLVNTEPHGDHWTGNAFFDATGVRMHEFPMTPERVLAALHKK